MKPIKKDLHSVIKGLKLLVKKTERMERELNAPTVKTRKASVTRGRKRGSRNAGTAMNAVYKIIEKNKRGATTTKIREKSGLDNKQIWNAINRLKTQNKIKSAKRGVYVAF